MDYDELIARHREQFRASMPSAMERLNWSAEELAAERQRKLRTLLAWAKERSPFYQKRLAGTDPATFTEADLPSIPALTKDELMDNFDAVLTDPQLTLGLVNDHISQLTSDAYLLDSYHAVASGGTTGRRGVFVYGWDEWMAVGQQGLRWRIRRTAGSPQVQQALTFGSVVADRASHISSSAPLLTVSTAGTAMLRLPITLPLAEVVAGLNAGQPNALLAYPSALDLLMGEARSGRLNISPVVVVSSGEVLTDATRESVRAVWQAEIADSWACSEGLYATPCDAGTAMHWSDDLAIIEPVDQHGDPVPPGVPAAKILITSLFQLTQPLIRYEITDEMTLLDEPCACGCAHRRIANLTGRSDDLFRYGEATVVHPLVFRSPLGRDRHVVEYQVMQTPRGAAIYVRTEGEAPLEPLRHQIIGDLTGAGLADPEVTITKVDYIDRLPTGKQHRFIPLGHPANTAQP